MTEKSTDRPNERVPTFDRRTYLKAATGVAAIAAVGTSAVSADEDYDVFEVPAGQTHSIRLGDGDVLENVLIDITANGAGYDINASGDDWVIRNVGIRGSWDYNPGSSVFRVRVRSPNASGLIENVYLGDGDQGTTWRTTGIFVYRDHAGDLEIRNVNIQNFSDNGLYGSAPGNPSHHGAPGSNGVVRVIDSYAAGNEKSGFRLGTEGSYCENCVMWNNHGQRGYWGYYQTTELIDCDIGSHSGDISAGASVYNSAATVVATNTRFETTTLHYNRASIVGSSAGRPQHRSPEDVGAPTSAEVAASGASGSGGSDDEDDEASIEDVWLDDEANHVVLEGGHDGVSEYTLDGVGDAEYGDDANTREDDPYRDVITADGGEFVIEGYLGGSRDDYYIEGAVGTVDADSDVTAIVNDVEFDPAELEGVGSWDDDDEDEPETHALEVAGQFAYRIEVSGEIEPAEEHAQWLEEGDVYGDDWAEWWLSGSDNAVTVWEFTGEITDLQIDERDGTIDIRTLAVDGEELDHDEFVDDTGPSVLEVAGQFEYRVEVSGEIEPVQAHARWLREGDAYGDDWAEWWLSGSDNAHTSWEFTGEIVDLEVDEYDGETEIRTLAVDGEELDHDEYL